MKKRKFKKGLIVLVILSLLVILGIKLFFQDEKKEKPKDLLKTGYLASSSLTVKLYDETFLEVMEVIRGAEIKIEEKEVINAEQIVYNKIKYENKTYLVLKENISYDEAGIVMEKNMYVRTPVSVYENAENADLIGLLVKGSKVDITGYDFMDMATGIVNMYKVKYNETEGYVYNKYLVSTEEEALKNYDEEGKYQTHLARPDTLGGGSAGNLDYYPYEKPVFAENTIPSEVRSLYVNVGVLGNIDAYIEFALNNNINAFVVDVKESGLPSYKSESLKELSPTNYEKGFYTLDEFKAIIKKLNDKGFYTIGRISTFKDYYYAQDNPENAIVNNAGALFSHNGSYWPSPFKRDVWEYNVKLAVEAVKEFGFNEIQFDYVRFTDRTYSLEANGSMNMRNEYGEEKGQAIQRFLMYACDEIHKYGAYVSADVFGESAYTYVTAYGQYWPAISNVVDVISGMPYPDHFNAHDFGIAEVVWTVPYKLMNVWASYASARQKEIPTPAIVRTWIQAYNTIKAPYITYDSTKISDQIKALYDNGLKGGYMTWNGGSSLEKYKSLAEAFKKEY